MTMNGEHTTVLLQTSSGSAVPDRLLWMCLQSGADFRGGGYERALAAISRRPDGHDIIRRLIRFVGVDGLQDYVKYMLEAAVEDGSGASVKVRMNVSVCCTPGADEEEGSFFICSCTH